MLNSKCKIWTPITFVGVYPKYAKDQLYVQQLKPLKFYNPQYCLKVLLVKNLALLQEPCNTTNGSPHILGLAATNFLLTYVGVVENTLPHTTHTECISM